MIWSLVVIEPQTLIVSECFGITPAISRTITQIREETLSIFYNANTFRFQVWEAEIGPILPKILLWHDYYKPKLDEWGDFRNNIKGVDMYGHRDWRNFCGWARRTWKGEVPVLYDGERWEWFVFNYGGHHSNSSKMVNSSVYLLKELGQGQFQEYSARQVEEELNHHWEAEMEEGRRWYL